MKKKEKKYIKLVKQIINCLKCLRVRKYNSKFSKKVFNNWVHIVLLALRQRMDKSYREFCDIIDVCTEILKPIGYNESTSFYNFTKGS